MRSLNSTFLTNAVLACAVIGGLSLPVASPAQAETRDAAFQRVLANPNDPDAMLAYARAAVEARDYEAVVSTLERLLDAQPGNSEARFELGVAYFALGSYELAGFHFALLQELDPQGPRAQDVTDYQERIADRTAENKVTGRIAAGIAVTEDGSSAALSANLRWSVDLGQANDTTWQTDLLAGVFSGDDTTTTSRLKLRTGLQFAITGEAYGPRLRPYAQIERVDDDDGDTYTSVGAGVQYFNAYNAQWSSFADFNFGRFNGSGTTSDGDRWAAIAGASYTPSRRARLRFSIFASERDADGSGSDIDRVGVRIDYRQAFPSPLSAGGRNWIAGAFIQHDQIDYSASGRDDELTSFGVSLRAFVRGDVYVEAGARSIRRNSSNNGFDDTTPMISLLVGREF